MIRSLIMYLLSLAFPCRKEQLSLETDDEAGVVTNYLPILIRRKHHES